MELPNGQKWYLRGILKLLKKSIYLEVSRWITFMFSISLDYIHVNLAEKGSVTNINIILKREWSKLKTHKIAYMIIIP